MRRCVAPLLAASVVAGCAASGPTGSEILARGAKPGTARLVIYRTSPTGFAIQPDYAIDGRKVGSSQPNGFIVCELPPGEHTVSVGNFPLSISIGPGADSFTTKLRLGTTTYLHAEPRLGIITPGTIGLTQVAENQGRADTAKLYKSESQC
jgi:hypothetical protein